MPFISRVAIGSLPKLKIFGSDYLTHDGTGVRDYIHVVDLAIGHLKALDAVLARPGLISLNLGTGQGYSVLDMVHAFEAACGVSIPYETVARRPGDIAVCYADPSLAFELLGWVAERGLTEMCQSSWKWQRENPLGYCQAL